MTVKNEADIFPDVIASASTWAENIIVMDNNSSDGTWEKLLKIKDENPKVIIWGRYFGSFKDSLRQRMFEDYKHLAKDGDWWCRLDADEIYIDNPLEIISSLPPNVDYINSASFQFYLTEKDIKKEIESDFSYERLSYFKCNWSETRFIRHSSNLIWQSNMSWPLNICVMANVFIRLKHYQYRNVDQISERIQTRKKCIY